MTDDRELRLEAAAQLFDAAAQELEHRLRSRI